MPYTFAPRPGPEETAAEIVHIAIRHDGSFGAVVRIVTAAGPTLREVEGTLRPAVRRGVRDDILAAAVAAGIVPAGGVDS